MTIIAELLKPYVLFLQGAAYSIGQTLDGLGVLSSNIVETDVNGQIIGSYLSPSEAYISILLGLLLLYLMLLVGALFLSGYVLGKWRGALIATFIISLPGIASLLGIFPNINYLPDKFVIHGTGTLGSVGGMFPLVLIGLLTGWSLVLLLSDLFDLGDRFRHYFDHFWYSMAVLAGIFFVADTGNSDVLRELDEANQLSKQASIYLLREVRAYDAQCNRTPSIGKVSCSWASDVQQELSDYVVVSPQSFANWGPKSASDIYDPYRGNISSDQIQQIRHELKAYNSTHCPVKDIGRGWSQQSRSSSVCLRPPSAFCTAFPEPLDGVSQNNTIFRTVAISNECVVASLVALRARQEKLVNKVSEIEESKHSRWLFFALFSVVAGGKVANASARVAELDRRNQLEKRRLLKLVRNLLSIAWKLIQRSASTGRRILSSSLRLVGRVIAASWKR
ncbi:MAG: hypothetical protein M0P64_03000 [Candidatus Pacebacteria bacterium]|nr:hypothetical protein [Candidatus Paceibacterota bacterium]